MIFLFVALDPAGPVYEGTIHTNLTNILRQLKPDDAGFTDVYHTSYISGNLEMQGMVDVYINGAGVLAAQPECLDLIGVIEGFSVSWKIYKWKREHFKLE